jgi:hypothetical protein
VGAAQQVARAVSIESKVRRSLWRLTFWRLMGDVVDCPAAIIGALARMVNAVADLFHAAGKACFLMELEASRQYTLLTGIDLGVAEGDDERYSGMDAARNQRIQSELDDDD